MNKLDELKKHIAQASELLLESAAPFDRACTIVNELKAELDKLEQDAKTKPWPHVGDKYLTIDYDGQTVLSVWEDDEFDRYRLATGNCHRTEAEALAYRERQTDPRVVARGMIERMDGADPSGNYVIALFDDQIQVNYHTSHKFGSFEFKELGHAQAVVDKHLDLCKVALGVITDKEEAGRIVRLAIGNVSDSGEAMGK